MVLFPEQGAHAVNVATIMHLGEVMAGTIFMVMDVAEAVAEPVVGAEVAVIAVEAALADADVVVKDVAGAIFRTLVGMHNQVKRETVRAQPLTTNFRLKF